MHFAANVAREDDNVCHALVVEDVTASLLLEKKAVNVNNHLMLSGAGRINKVKMCLDPLVKEAQSVPTQMSAPF
jgi:hypothetical protein